MKDVYNNLLRMMLSIGLSQRELFIEKASQIISDKMKADPEYGEMIAQNIVSLAESFKDHLFMKHMFAEAGKAVADSQPHVDYEGLMKKMDELNHSILKLTELLQTKHEDH